MESRTRSSKSSLVNLDSSMRPDPVQYEGTNWKRKQVCKMFGFFFFFLTIDSVAGEIVQQVKVLATQA